MLQSFYRTREGLWTRSQSAAVVIDAVAGGRAVARGANLRVGVGRRALAIEEALYSLVGWFSEQ